MPTPFPGMDPYLERGSLWQNVHNSLIVAIRDDLAPRLAPHYYVGLEERMYLLEPTDLIFLGRPDVSVGGPPRGMRETSAAYAAEVDGGVAVTLAPAVDQVVETFLTIVDVERDEIVTAIEILSPSNKQPGKGREIYRDKRMAILDSTTHLIEIDLLRAWEPLPLKETPPASDYRILLSRVERRPKATLIPFGVRQPIPRFPIPLRPGDSEPWLDLNGLLHSLYDRAGFAMRLKYRAEPEPPLNEADAAWADGLLREAGLR